MVAAAAAPRAARRAAAECGCGGGGGRRLRRVRERVRWWRLTAIGLGWRPELAAGILAHLDAHRRRRGHRRRLLRRAARATLRALRTLARAGAGRAARRRPGPRVGAPVDAAAARRRGARSSSAVRPASWSEHLAFVRGGGREIGHLAAPPRARGDASRRRANLARARARSSARRPLVENVATLIDPPGSDCDEPDLDRRRPRGGRTPTCCSTSTTCTPTPSTSASTRAAFLDRLPARARRGRAPRRRRAGSRPATGTRRLLDDHLHDVPDPGVRSCSPTLRRARPRPLTVILERDGDYPPAAHLLAELRRARSALASGRAERQEAAS